MTIQRRDVKTKRPPDARVPAGTGKDTRSPAAKAASKDPTPVTSLMAGKLRRKR